MKAIILPTIVFTILVVLGATMHPLWGDEAETALFARNILTYGVPKGWDGVNIMGINDAIVLNEDLINHTSPWVQYYLVAAFFFLFGESSFTARLPFVILSIISIPLLYYFALALTREKRVAFFVCLILSLSIPFILFSFQARYYSLTTLASLIFVFSCLFLTIKRLIPKIAFVLSGIVFFYSNYVSFVAFYIATFVSYLALYFLNRKPWQEIKRFIFWFAGLSIVIVLFWIPWYLVLKPFETRGALVIPPIFELLQGFVILLSDAYAPYHSNNTFPQIFILVFVGMILLRIWQKKKVAELILPILISFIFLSVMTFFSEIALTDTLFIQNRYTTVIFPFLALASSFLMNEMYKFNKVFALFVLFIYLATTVFTFQKAQSLLLDFVSEVKNPYPTSDKVVADFLKENAREGEYAFVSLDRDHEPLIFHLKDKIRFVDRVSLANTRIFPKNRDILPRYVYQFGDYPDWIILYSKRGNDGTFLTFDFRPVYSRANLVRDYEEIVLPVFFADMSRPEIELRSFTEVKPSSNDQVFIYRRKKR